MAFAQGVPADGYYEIRVKAEAKFRKNSYAPDFFGTDPAMPFRLGVVAGNAKAGPLHLPQPIEPQLGETIVKDDEPEWHTFKVWLDRGFTPRFTFPNGMLNVRNAYNRLIRVYNSTFPVETRKTTGRHRRRTMCRRSIRMYGARSRCATCSPSTATTRAAMSVTARLIRSASRWKVSIRLVAGARAMKKER